MLDTWCFYIIQLDFNFKIIFKLEYIHYLNEIFFLIFNAKINLILKMLKNFYYIFQLKSRKFFFYKRLLNNCVMDNAQFWVHDSLQNFLYEYIFKSCVLN